MLIAGEAGAGKTTLAEHVLAQAPARVLRGRAAEWAGTAYDALARALRPAVAEQPPAGEHDILAQVMPELGTPPPVPDAGALAAAVCSVLGPGLAVLFLDDLQWADDATLSLLPPLADAASGRGDRPRRLLPQRRTSPRPPAAHRPRAAAQGRAPDRDRPAAR